MRQGRLVNENRICTSHFLNNGAAFSIMSLGCGEATLKLRKK